MKAVSRFVTGTRHDHQMTLIELFPAVSGSVLTAGAFCLAATGLAADESGFKGAPDDLRAPISGGLGTAELSHSGRRAAAPPAYRGA